MLDLTLPNAANVCAPFLSGMQLEVIADNCRGEEREFFKAKLKELAGIIEKMPKTYETDGQGGEAIVYLHYFTGAFDFYVTEKDSEEEQIQAFGLVKAFETELGYINIKEIVSLGGELDLHWTPCKLSTITEKGE